MQWTTEQKLAALMELPWTIRVENGEGGPPAYLVARVKEIPDAIATGDTERALGKDLYESLQASLAVRLQHDDPIPLPPGKRLPWDGAEPPRPVTSSVTRVMRSPWATGIEMTTTASGGSRRVDL